MSQSCDVGSLNKSYDLPRSKQPQQLVPCHTSKHVVWAHSCDMITPHTTLVCETVEGAASATIDWVVTVGGQNSVAPSTSAAPPVVTAVELFDVKWNDAKGLNGTFGGCVRFRNVWHGRG